MKILERLKNKDGCREITLDGTPCYIHEDHRFVLPLICNGQENGWLPTPTTIVMFDAHHDACVPRELEQVQSVARSAVTPEAVLQLCESHLSPIDDDWVVAGMELGLIKDAVIFGVERNIHRPEGDTHVDWKGTEHLVWITNSLPGGALGYQGDLSDHARAENYLQRLWDALGWNLTPGRGFGFAPDAARILLDLDLDCFSAQWRDAMFTWPDEVWNAELYEVSEYSLTLGWSGKRFFDALRRRAGAITICREASYCGGEEICNQNMAKVSHFLFDHDKPL